MELKTEDKDIMERIIKLLSRTRGWKIEDVVDKIRMEYPNVSKTKLYLFVTTMIYNKILNINNGNIHTNMTLLEMYNGDYDRYDFEKMTDYEKQYRSYDNDY